MFVLQARSLFKSFASLTKCHHIVLDIEYFLFFTCFRPPQFFLLITPPTPAVIGQSLGLGKITLVSS